MSFKKGDKVVRKEKGYFCQLLDSKTVYTVDEVVENDPKDAVSFGPYLYLKEFPEQPFYIFKFEAYVEKEVTRRFVPGDMVILRVGKQLCYPELVGEELAVVGTDGADDVFFVGREGQAYTAKYFELVIQNVDGDSHAFRNGKWLKIKEAVATKEAEADKNGTPNALRVEFPTPAQMIDEVLINVKPADWLPFMVGDHVVCIKDCYGSGDTIVVQKGEKHTVESCSKRASNTYQLHLNMVGPLVWADHFELITVKEAKPKAPIMKHFEVGQWVKHNMKGMMTSAGLKVDDNIAHQVSRTVEPTSPGKSQSIEIRSSKGVDIYGLVASEYFELTDDPTKVEKKTFVENGYIVITDSAEMSSYASEDAALTFALEAPTPSTIFKAVTRIVPAKITQIE